VRPEGRADHHLRIRRIEVLGFFHARHASACEFEGPRQGLGAVQGVDQEGAAKVGQLGLRSATEGTAIRARGCDHQRLRTAQCVDESTRVAGRKYQHAPVDGGTVECVAQRFGIDLVQRQRFEIDVQPMVLGAVGGREQQQQVFVALHSVADAGERATQIAERRQRVVLAAVRVVQQHQGTRAHAEALGEQALRVQRFVAEDVFVGVAGEGEQKGVDLSGRAGNNGCERLIDAVALRIQQCLRAAANRPRDGGGLFRPGLGLLRILRFGRPPIRPGCWLRRHGLQRL